MTDWLHKGYAPGYQDELWTMKDGTKIPVGQMSEQHAKNTLRMLIRYLNKLEVDYYDALDAWTGHPEDL